MFPSRKQVEEIRQRFPAGTRIRLIQMNDDPNPIPSGTLGTVQYVDDAGQLGMLWDNGRSLSLIAGKDVFEIVR